MRVAVVYLAYVPMGTNYLVRFLESYKRQNTQVEHELFIVCNGLQKANEIEPFKDILYSHNIEAKIIPTKAKFDIGAYFSIARQITHDYILFFNTYTQLLAPRWLEYYVHAIQKPSVGTVGATGSWGNKARDDQFRLFLREKKYTLDRLKELVKYWYNFYPLVTPHLRTNAFMVKRSIFIGLKYQLFKPLVANLLHMFRESKLTTECFEHGKYSFTNQLLNKGLQVLVVDRFGNTYPITKWNTSHTFWSGEQENLLVSDNQTEKYENGSLKERNRLNYLAFGINKFKKERVYEKMV